MKLVIEFYSQNCLYLLDILAFSTVYNFALDPHAHDKDSKNNTNFIQLKTCVWNQLGLVVSV